MGAFNYLFSPVHLNYKDNIILQRVLNTMFSCPILSFTSCPDTYTFCFTEKAGDMQVSIIHFSSHIPG